MPPPGRRRSHFLQLLAFLLLFSNSIHAINAVLGIDLGTEYIKAALVKPGIPLEIVLTKDSKRKESSAIALKPSPQSAGAQDFPERLYGADALALAPRFPNDVYPNLKHLLGAAGHDAVPAYRARYPALDLIEHNNGTIAFASKSFPVDGNGVFSVEELLAMELQSIRLNAEQMAGSEVKSAVFTVPPFWSADEKRALEFAASLAGIRVLGLVSDGMAVGLNYATTRTFANPDEGGKPEYHLVYDMGAGSTKTTLLRMQGKTVKDVGKRNKTIQEVSTLSVGYEKGLGGDALNDLIVNDMVNKFVESSGAKKAGVEASAVRANGRAMAKLWRESERLRQVLSANTATSGFFESFYEDIDFRYKLSRADFETMATAFSEKVSSPLNDALTAANLKLDDITSIILHGGAVRTPFVQSILEGIAGDAAKLKSNVNADEAAVFGAAFKAAGLSPSFKVKEIRDLDLAMYPVFLHYNLNGKDRKQQIFVPTSQAGAVKQLPMKTLDDFSISFSQKLPLIDVERSVLQVQTNNLTASITELVNTHGCIRENISTIASIRLDPLNYLPEVTKVAAVCELTEIEKKEGLMDGVKGMFGFGKKDSQQKPLADDEDENAELLEPLPESTPESTTSKTSSTEKSSASALSSSSSKSKDTKPVKKTITIPINLKNTPTGRLLPTDLDLNRITEGLRAFDLSDKGRRLREELYNGLEAFTYRVRDMLTDSKFTAVSTSDQRSVIEKALTSTNEWLHSDGSSAGIDLIKSKLQDLKGLVDPVQKRKEETTKRPIAVERLQGTLKKASSLKNVVSKQISSLSSVASASAASASATASSLAGSASEAVVPDKDPFVELEENLGGTEDEKLDPSASLSSLLARITSTIDPSAFTPFDLDQLTDLFTSTTDWLDEKLEGQKRLLSSDDPVLTSLDLESKEKALKKMIEDLQRKKKVFEANVSRSVSSAKKSASKASKSAKDAAKSAASAASATVSAAASETTGDEAGDGEPATADATASPVEEATSADGTVTVTAEAAAEATVSDRDEL